jgi:AbrB family looped-hinge helix DNA binding protein
MRITSKGRITIPQQVRRQLGLEPGDEVDVVVAEDGAAKTIPADGPRTRGERIIAALTGKAEVGSSTDEIMALTREK